MIQVKLDTVADLADAKELSSMLRSEALRSANILDHRGSDLFNKMARALDVSTEGAR